MDGNIITNKIPDYYISENKEAAIATVVFRVVFNWEKESALWPELSKIKMGANLKIRLLRDGKPVSNVFQVEFVNVSKPPSQPVPLRP